MTKSLRLGVQRLPRRWGLTSVQIGSARGIGVVIFHVCLYVTWGEH